MFSGLSCRGTLHVAGALALAASLGCRSLVDRPQPRLQGPQLPPPVGESVPTEKERSTLPAYTVEAPDVLFIEAVRMVPKPPYHIRGGDQLQIIVDGTPPEAPIAGANYFVDPSGRVDLGPQYGKVTVAGMTTEEATEAIAKHLEESLSDAKVSVTIGATAGLQPISGEHLVSPDGTVNLGTYGLVYVAGMTLEDAKAAIEEHLSKFLDHPEISVSVFAYNSKVYYVITEGAGSGDSVARLPITGNETVLDAISQINGLSRLSSKNMWIARPAPGGSGCDVILPVSWKEITKGAATATNYQVLPGDRIFIAENKLIAVDAVVNQIISPFERVFGVTLLGAQTVQTINRFPLGISGISSGF
jgi:polysaccharide biosynthesis/export protein